jgi:hypothetical protein
VWGVQPAWGRQRAGVRQHGISQQCIYKHHDINTAIRALSDNTAFLHIPAY